MARLIHGTVSGSRRYCLKSKGAILTNHSLCGNLRAAPLCDLLAMAPGLADNRESAAPLQKRRRKELNRVYARRHYYKTLVRPSLCWRCLHPLTCC